MKILSNLSPGVTDRMIEEQANGRDESKDIAYAEAMEKQEGIIRAAKQRMLGEIFSYIAIEDFPFEHLRALKKIVLKFNWSEESEKEIFDFSDMIEEKYK